VAVFSGLLLLAVTGICAAPEAVLHTSGGTTLDGEAAFDGMRVFGGQMLQTKPGQSGELLLPGNSIRVLGDSRVRYLGDASELMSGGIVLSTSTGFAVSSGCMRALPTRDTTASYTVRLVDKTVYVTVEAGEVNVKSKREVRVPALKTAAIYCASPKQEIVIAGHHLAAKMALGSGIAVLPVAGLAQSGSKQEISTESTSHR
jgi:hypothetical protein